MTKILIIDDESFNRDLLKSALKLGGYSNIIEAENGTKGVDLVKVENPDLVFLDLKLPDIYGREVLIKLKEQKFMGKIIILSTVNQEEMGQDNQLTQIEAKDLGVHSWIFKPITNEKILSEIKKILN